MPRFVMLAAFLAVAVLPLLAGEQQPAKPLVSGLKDPSSVAVGSDGKTYVVSNGAVFAITKSVASPIAAGLADARAIAAYQKSLYVAGKDRIWLVDPKGKGTTFAAPEDFPTPPVELSHLTIDPEGGAVYVSDAGNSDNQGAAIYRLPQKGGKFPPMKGGGGKASTVTDQKRWPELKRPSGIVLDGQNHLLVLDSATGTLHRLHLADGTRDKVADGLGQASALAWDWHGRLYISDPKGGQIRVIPRPGMAPVLLSKNFQAPAALSLDATGKQILVADQKAGTVTAVPAQVPGAVVDESTMDLQAVQAFPKLKWTDWQPETAKGLPNALRPITLTHANDSSNRIFVGTQHGVIHVFPNDPNADKTKVFLDMSSRVSFKDKENEEGFLGLAFHPNYKKTGEFFVFYTQKKAIPKHVNVVSRFRVSKDDPDKADPDFEEELMRFEHGFWNHDGGTLCFGPDGYLYIAVGDGGSANDPMNNGQNLKSPLAKIHRIDVDKKDAGKNYAVPKDNPFVGRADAIPETWAYGLRNVSRMNFDKKTGKLWAADVGQNLYEEINLIEKGGNYGWKVRESLHPFSAKGVGPRKDLIDPIWEYHHKFGPSITGGHVYRGKNLPELDGYYIYGDYVNTKLYALRYDEAEKRVTANRILRGPNLPILSFGEDEPGEVYMLTYSAAGKGIYQIQRSTK